MENLFDTKDASLENEIFTDIFSTKGIRTTKILSMGQVSKNWYDQGEGEWVCVLEGEGHILFEDGSTIKLSKGAHTYIPPHKKHKVSYCTRPCLWLCVFIDVEN